MAERIFKILIRSTGEIIKSTLSLIAGKLPKVEYNHVKRLLYDGARRDIIFMRGISTGVKLAGMPQKKAQILIEILKGGIDRENNGEKVLFKKEELKKIDELLKGVFNLGTRKRIINTIETSDSVLLNGLIKTLEESYKKSV